MVYQLLLSNILCLSFFFTSGVTAPEQGSYEPSPKQTVDNVLSTLENQPQTLDPVSPSLLPVSLDRLSYSATTPDEITAKKLEEARIAAEQEMERQRNALKSRGTPAYANYLAVNNSCYNNYCWPVNQFSFTYGQNGFRTSERPAHNGFDMLTGQGTPIVAVAEGVVRLSQESYAGYGVAIVIDSVIDGQTVSMTYGHMTYGSRVVQAGEHVSAGQLIGLVGSTGNSTANHLHLEIALNGVLTDPYPWLVNHAGPLSN